MDSLLLDFNATAGLILFSPATIANWAYGRKPAPKGFPAPIKVGRILRYRRLDLETWIANLRGGESVLSSASESNIASTTKRRPRGRPRLVRGENHG